MVVIHAQTPLHVLLARLHIFFLILGAFQVVQAELLAQMENAKVNEILFGCFIICLDCPSHCAICTSSNACQVCDQDYILANASSCVLPPTSSFPKVESEATRTITSSVTGVGSAVCVGSATFSQVSIVSKIVQNMRYINLTVTDELSEVYQTWSTTLISWDVPNVLAHLNHFKAIPYLFSQFDLDSPFLMNFWSSLMTMGVGITVFIGSFLLKVLFERMHHKGWAYLFMEKVLLGSFNFALVQVYGCLDDILFYLVLDLKGNPFDSAYAWASVICACGFMVVGGLLVYFNFWMVESYQRTKRQGRARKDMSAIEDFNEKNKYWELFYADFYDTDFLSQSALALMVIRGVSSSFIITVLTDYPLLQTTLLIASDFAMILFLIKKNPFVTLRGKLAQYYFEAITLLVHSSAFVLSFQGYGGRFTETLLMHLCKSVIYLNLALMIGSVGFMFIELYKAISEYVKSRYRKYETIAIQAGTEDDDDTQIINLGTSTGTQSPEKRNWMKNTQVAPIENSDLLPEQSQRSFTGINLLVTNNFSMIAEDSVLQDVDRNTEQGGGSATPIIIRNRRVNIKRRQTNGSALEKQPK